MSILDTSASVWYSMRGREFPPPLLPSQLLIEKDESGNKIQAGGGEVDVGVGLAAVLFCPLAHGVHLLSTVLLYYDSRILSILFSLIS